MSVYLQKLMCALGGALTLYAIQNLSLINTKKKRILVADDNIVLSFLNAEDKQILDKIENGNFHNIIKVFSDKLNEMQIFQKVLPRKIDNDLSMLTQNLVYCQGKDDYIGITKSICDPIYELLDRGGKRLRPILALLIGNCFNKNWDDISEIATIVECIHNASLIVDDIEDNSEFRRDKPCVHKIYGIDISINAGNFLYYAPTQLILKSSKFTDETKLKLFKVYCDEMINIHLGQGWDIAWHNSQKLQLDTPTEDQYLQMTSYKTGVILRLTAKMIAIQLDLDHDISEKLAIFCERIGIAFQIQDDILNLVGEEYKQTKGYLGEDIHEGKMSLMVIHSLNNSPQNEKLRLKEILQMQTSDINLINEAIEIIQKSKSIEYSKQKANDLIITSWQNVESGLPSGKAKQLVHEIAKFCAGRNF